MTFVPLSGESVRFLRGKANALFIWPAAAIFASAVGWAALLTDLEKAKETYEIEVLADSAALSRNYAENLQRALELVDQIALHVRYEWELSKGTLRLEATDGKAMFPFPALLSVTILNGDGVPLTSSGTSKRAISLSNDELLFNQRTAAGDALFISGPRAGGISENNVIQISRKLKDSTGNFAGIVLVSVIPDYLTTGYDRVMLGKHGFLGVAGPGSIVYVTRTGDVVHTPNAPSLASSPVFSARSGSFQLSGRNWFSDERDRFVGWQTLDDYPLVAMVGLDSEEALSHYWSNRASAIRTGQWATAVLFLFALLTMGFSVRLAWRKHSHDMTQTTYRMATESGTEGFFIGKPICDANNQIIDIELVDCNQRGAGFLLRRREQVVGKTISALYGGLSPAKLMDLVRQAAYTGAFEGEMKVSEESPLSLDWIYLKILRSNGNVAITVRDISDTKAHVAELERQSNQDALTGLPNRHWLQGYLPRAIEHATSSHGVVALLFLDLDGFKTVNDTMGHPAGDELLQNAARRLKLAVRPHDHVVRLGGDEFVVLVEHVSSKADIAQVGKRVLQAFQETFRLSYGVASIGTSIGISIFPADGQDADTLLKHADIALYSVKARGKGRYAFFNPTLRETLQLRIEKEEEFRKALKNDEFLVLYQPRVEMSTGRILSMEALVRWQHPSKGLLKPNDFLKLAEETGLVIELGKRVLEKVCSQIVRWSENGKEPVPISINVSRRQFINADMAELLSTTLARHKVDPTLIQLEIKEVAATSADSEASRLLKLIQETGVQLLVDNFGTGNLSISSLQSMGFNLLKVDCTLTSKVNVTEEAKVYFAAVIMMAHALGMRVVADGVENEEQANALLILKCDEMQGYYVSKPLISAETETLLRNQNRLPSQTFS